jgi:hypothetical protein
MSKFFIQLLLSIVVGVGAVVSLRQDVREGLKETFHQTADVVTTAISDMTSHVNASASTSTEFNTKASAQPNAQADLKVKDDLDVQVNNGGTLLHSVTPNLSTKGSATVNSQSNANVNTQGAELQLKDKTNSALNISLDPLK